MRRLATSWIDDLGFEPPVAVVFAAGNDKDVQGMLARLHAFAPAAALFTARTANERARSSSELAEHAQRAGFAAEAFPDVARAIDAAFTRFERGRVLLCGSLFAVGEAMKAFGGAPGEQS
jgi:folylpolyglutamate synthase/dihydropteroate synthase